MPTHNILDFLHKIFPNGSNKQTNLELMIKGAMDKRKFSRIPMEKLQVDVSNGIGFFSGTISDISRFGLCLSELPKHFDCDVKNMTIVVSSHGNHFKMNVRPRWYTDGGMIRFVGVEITDTQSKWTEYVMNLEPIIDKTIWGDIHL